MKTALKILFGAITPVVLLLVLPVLWASAVFDVKRHALLALEQSTPIPLRA